MPTLLWVNTWPVAPRLEDFPPVTLPGALFLISTRMRCSVIVLRRLSTGGCPTLPQLAFKTKERPILRALLAEGGNHTIAPTEKSLLLQLYFGNSLTRGPLAMSIAKQALLTELDYSAWANQRLLNASATLSADEFERDLGASHRSIAGTLRHIFDAERSWLIRLSEMKLPPLAETNAQGLPTHTFPEPGLNALNQQFPAVWNGWRQWIESLSEAELDGGTPIYKSSFPVNLQWSKPAADEFRIPRWKWVLHVVNHSTLHRGQVMSMFRNLGKPTPGTDLSTYYLETAE